MLGVINFAHGALFTLGGYVPYWVKDVLGLPGALVAAPVAGGAAGRAHRGDAAATPLRGGTAPCLLLTLGLAMVLE